jgi:hypothetical protein
MTLVVIQTQWKDADSAHRRHRQFNLIARLKK